MKTSKVFPLDTSTPFAITVQIAGLGASARAPKLRGLGSREQALSCEVLRQSPDLSSRFHIVYLAAGLGEDKVAGDSRRVPHRRDGSMGPQSDQTGLFVDSRSSKTLVLMQSPRATVLRWAGEQARELAELDGLLAMVTGTLRSVSRLLDGPQKPLSYGS